MTLYELNQVGYANLPTMTEQEIEEAKIKVISPFIMNHASHYYMLLCNEKHYYTVFALKATFESARITKTLFEIFQELGEIKSIEENNGALEFWIKAKDEETCNVYVLFDYSQGVVEI